LAIRIPPELACSDMGVDLEIIRSGDVITIFPSRSSLKDVIAAPRGMAKPDLVERRERIKVPVRHR
jgi:antitoxin VapB